MMGLQFPPGGRGSQVAISGIPLSYLIQQAWNLQPDKGWEALNGWIPAVGRLWRNCLWIPKRERPPLPRPKRSGLWCARCWRIAL